MEHIFVSYSHLDKNYVHKLADDLRARGFDIWIDESLEYGETWTKEIQEQLDTCAAFIVILSENSDKSEWVHNELTRAKRKQKPIFPVLLSGEHWLAVEGRQYVDVKDGSLPSERFYQRLERETARTPRPTPPPPQPDPGPGPHTRPRTPRPDNRRIYLAGGIMVASVFCLCAIFGLTFGEPIWNTLFPPISTIPVATEIMQHPTDPPSSPTATSLPVTALPTMISPDWPVVVHDSFDSNTNEWKVGDLDNELAEWHSSIANGRLLWHIIANKAFSGWLEFAGPDVSDFLLNVDITQVSGPPSAKYGVAVRRDDAGTSHYTFRIYDDAFSFDFLQNSKWTTLFDPTPSPAIKPNEQNHLTVLGMGSHFTFYINDQFVGEIDDSQLSTGTIALVAGLDNAGDQAVFEFDNFELRAP